jgi:hypothetical protein
MLAGIERDVADHRRDPFEMTDAECVEAVHKLCHLHPPGWSRPEPDPEKEAEVVAAWRELNGR